MAEGQRPNPYNERIDGENLVQTLQFRISEIDDVGSRFFRCIQSPQRDNPPSEVIAVSKTHLFRGEMIELWMLKTLCGLVASRSATDGP